MAHFPARAVKEICSKPARLFTHAVVFGLAALQFGCASMKSFSNEPSIPPETQEAILRGIVQNANGQPFKLMDAVKFDTLMKNVQETWGEIVSPTNNDDRSAETQRHQIIKKLKDAKEYLCENTKTLADNKAEENTTCEERVKDEDLFQVARLYDGEVGARAVSIGAEDNQIKLLVVRDIDNLMQPSSLEKDFFKQGLGLEGLDEILGGDFFRILREHTLLHEAGHLGDTRPLAEEAAKSGKGAETIELKREIFAEAAAVGKMNMDKEHIDFLRILVHLRALNCVLTGDAGHAVQFNIAKLLEKHDPSFIDYAELDEERVYKAVQTIRELFPAVFVESSIWQSEEARFREGSKKLYGQLAALIKGENVASYQKEKFEDADVQTTLKAAHKAWLFFDNILRQNGERCPVDPPPRMIGRQDLKGLKGLASRDGVGPK